MSNYTIKDLAQMAGVSQTAVSFVLNGKSGVSEKTRKKVLDIIEQVGYTANISSRCLALKKSFNIALLYSESSSPFDDLFYFDVARGALESCNNKGYNIVINKIRKEGGKTLLPGVITARNADGVLIFQDIEPKTVKEIEAYGAPVVVVDSYADPETYTGIGISAEAVTEAALSYLLSMGHREIGLIATGFIPTFREQVLSAYRKFMSSAGLPLRPEWITDRAHDEDSAYTCAGQILSSPDRPTAIFCTSDIYAISAINRIRSAGLRVPEDISVIGADNIVACRYVSPALTTVNYDKARLGQTACEMLMRRIAGEEISSVRVPILGIVERQSVIRRN